MDWLTGILAYISLGIIVTLLGERGLSKIAGRRFKFTLLQAICMWFVWPVSVGMFCYRAWKGSRL